MKDPVIRKYCLLVVWMACFYLSIRRQVMGFGVMNTYKLFTRMTAKIMKTSSCGKIRYSYHTIRTQTMEINSKGLFMGHPQ